MIETHPIPGSQRRKLGAAVLLATLTTVGTAAQAQLEEVVVTAQKRAQSANDVGITINAFTGDQLRDFGVLTAEDIAMLTPGLTVNETAATGVPLYTIRGVGFQDYSTAASSTVGIYFDEVAMPYTVMTRGLVFDTERVEVLKGPQGDLYGRNTTAGQINFISNKPTREFGAGSPRATAATPPSIWRVLSPVATTWPRAAWRSRPFSPVRAGRRARLAMMNWVKRMRPRCAGSSILTSVIALRLMLTGHYVKDKSENKANTAYSGTPFGFGEFSNPYRPLERVPAAHRQQLWRNPALVFHRRQRSCGLDQQLYQPNYRQDLRYPTPARQRTHRICGSTGVGHRQHDPDFGHWLQRVRTRGIQRLGRRFLQRLQQHQFHRPGSVSPRSCALQAIRAR